MACNLRQPGSSSVAEAWGVLNLAPLVCPVAVRLSAVCGPWMAARMIFSSDGWGTGKPTGETPHSGDGTLSRRGWTA